MDFSMRGWTKIFAPSKTSNAQAKVLFDSALHIDPDNIQAMVGKAACLANDVIFG
jgi:adenylate cyclase